MYDEGEVSVGKHVKFRKCITYNQTLISHELPLVFRKHHFGEIGLSGYESRVPFLKNAT